MKYQPASRTGYLYLESGKIRQSKDKTGAQRNSSWLLLHSIKRKSQIIIDAALNTTHTNKAHRSVVAVVKNSKSEGDAAPTANNVFLKQAVNWKEEAHLDIVKQAMTNRPPLLVENVATTKAVPPDKNTGK